MLFIYQQIGATLLFSHEDEKKIILIIPKFLHKNTNTAQAFESTGKEKIAAEPMGATNIFCLPVKPISYTFFRVSMQGFG